MRDLRALLEPVRAAARELPREDLPLLCGALATLQAELLLPPAPSSAPPEDRALSPAEIAKRLGMSRDWVYRNRHALPATRLPSGRWVVTESRLRRWLEARSKK